MTFIPYPGKIEIQPLKQEGVFDTSDNNFEEAGTVLQVGTGVTFVQEGDTLYFMAHGLWKTPEVDGVHHYIIEESSEYILGKIET